MEYLAYVVMVASLLSLLSTMHSWLRIRKNNADIDSIRDLTGIIKKSEIIRWFGNPDREGHYSVSPQRIARARTTIHKVIDDPYFDALNFVLAWVSLLQPTLSWVIIPVFIYVALSWGHAGYLICMYWSEWQDD